jgi:hypothetical protein
MDRKEWRLRFEMLPESARDYLFGSEAADTEDATRENLGYDYDAWARINDVIWELLLTKMDKNTFIAKIQSLANERNLDEVVRTILLKIILPVSDLVDWDVETTLQELGVLPSEIGKIKRISVLPVTYSAAVKRIATNAQVSVFSEELVRRLRDLLVSLITGVRTDAQALEYLQRKQAEDGLGFTDAQAKAFLVALDEFLTSSSVMSEQDYSEWYRTVRNSQGFSWKMPLEVDEKVEEEIPLGSMRLRRHYEPILEKAMQECLQQIGDLQLDDYLEKRLENVISTRLRNVRNALQTSSILTRDDKIGGLGLDAEKAERVARIIEASYELHHGEIEDDQKRRIQETEVAQKQKVEDRKKRESEEHAEWYQQKVAPPSFTNVMTTQQTTQAAQSMAQAPIRSNMSGVTAPAVSQLSDLIGEFKTMDIQEFRRLAKDPDQAGEKLFQKFETLRAESFERYTAGIAAWRQSPLQQRYLQLVSESFTRGKTVAEVAAAKLAQDPATPSPAELGAIITLNAKIQY